MECGEKLPKNKYCPECGMELPETARFCFSCGASISASSGVSVKDNVFGGNVSGSFNTTNNTINNTYITHNESDDVVECSVCGRMLSKGSGEAYKCKTCGKFFCADHIDKKHNACIYCVGEMKKEISAEAVKYYEKGKACYIARNFTEAVKWYRKGAELGNADAQDCLGECYCRGIGVAEDVEEAIKWYNKAAEQGHAQAQFALGEAYYWGEAVDQDYSVAVKWYRKAAEQGLAEAQYFLGECYYNGEGVAENIAEAKKWYKKAADQGNELAKDALEII